MVYGFFILVFFAFYTLLSWYFDRNKDTFKWHRKHVKKRKKIFMWFAIIALIFLLAWFEQAFSENTIFWLWIVHAVLFTGYFGFSAYQIVLDYKRVQRAILRRK